MHRHLTIFFAAVSLTGMSQAQEGPDLRINRQSASRILVEYSPQFYSAPSSPAGSGQTEGLELVGGIVPPGKPGSPALAHRAVSLLLGGSRARVRVIDAEYADRRDIRPSPRPEFVGDPKFGFVTRTRLLEAQGRSGFVPETVAEIADVGPVSGGFTGTLKLYPVRYDESAGVVRQYSRIVLEIESDPSPVVQRAVVPAADSPLSQGEWYRLQVRETGIYRLDQSFFSAAGISTSSLSDIASIRIFGNGGAPVPENLSTPRPNGFQEIARHIVDQNGNGQFDGGDYVLFYGSSPRRWNYIPGSKTFRHALNPYTEENSYFLTFGGLPGRDMESLSSPTDPSPHVPAGVTGMTFFEEERENLLSSGREWLGQHFDSESPTGSFVTQLPGLNSSQPVTYRIVMVGRTGRTEYFTVEESGTNLGSITIFPVALKSIQTEYAYKAPIATYMRSGSLSDNRSILRFTFQTIEGEGWLDWFEIIYDRLPVADGDLLIFPSPDTTAVIEYRMSGYSSRQVEVFDVSDHDSVVRIENLQFDPTDPGKCTFQASQTAGTIRMFAAVGPGGFKSPLSMQRIGNSNLMGITTGADFVIITPQEFRPEAERLGQHREQRDSLSTLLVNIEDIRNEYGAGLQDPLAVRDFLAAASMWTVRPRYVLLYGDGHYDYKGIRSSDPNWIPPYESVESIHMINTFASDDYLAILNPGNSRVSLAMGRLPVNSIDEARVVADKIIAYETSAPFGSWRNTVTYVADDGLTSLGDDRDLHTGQAEDLAQIYTPPQAHKKKIYIVEYPTVNSSSGRRKPTANDAIVEAINEGTLILNYTGHGNPQLWAHEAVFTREGSIPLLVNRDQPFMLVAATCDFARYDNPSEVSAGELVLTMEEAGAIGVVTASRAVYAGNNAQFNNSLYTEMFRRDPDGRPPRIGDAMYRNKQIWFSLNDLKFHLFADPTMRLNLPLYAAGVDSLNGSPLVMVTPVQALEKIDIAGELRRPDGSTWTEFAGRGLLEVFDARRRVVVPEWSGYTFEVNGSLLYRGEIRITDGRYRATVPIPKDVSYGTNRARVSLYAWTSSTDASGFSENIVISGSDSSAVPDTTGPGISILLEDESFRPGDVVSPDPELIVRLFDVNGINTSTASIGHRLEAKVSSTGEFVSLSEHYRGDLDTYQTGEVRTKLRGLPEGRQTLEVIAWDIYNNSSRDQIEFEVQPASGLQMYHVFNFPNPVARSTVFTFQRNTTDPIDVEVKVYTPVGRLIQSLGPVSIVDRFVQIPWDGRDQNGDQIANGVYFYKVIAKTLNGSRTREVVGKLTMLR
ncbi:MAG TPA: type IX secretion system sortase PorU [Bacteroidota bacterium]